jgi:hypothetical protein
MKPIVAVTILVFMYTLSPVTAQGQYAISSQDSLVKLLVNRHIALGQVKRTMPGYRVQIHFGPQRARANEVKSDFLKLYPNVGSYLVYHQPNFKIRVGDFKTRLEALRFLREIQSLYTSAFLVKDDVRLPE